MTQKEYDDAMAEIKGLAIQSVPQRALDIVLAKREQWKDLIESVAPTKTTGVCKASVLKVNDSLIFADPAGELLESIGDALRGQGTEVHVFNLVDMENSDSFNPFHYIREDVDVVDMVQMLIQYTTSYKPFPSDSNWEKAETAILCACCYLARESLPEEDQNFSKVSELLKSGIVADPESGPSVLDATFSAWEEHCKQQQIKSHAVKYYNIYKAAGGGKTAQSVLTTAMNRLQWFDLPAVQMLTNTDTIDLYSIADKKIALFCVVPSKADHSLNLAGLICTHLCKLFCPKLNLRGTYLTGADLSGADLSEADLRYADLRYANLEGAILTNADLFSANLTRANLTGADLSFADLTCADLRNATLSDADLTHADLSHANLTRANLRSTDLRYADLRYADSHFADLTDATLCYAFLNDANLSFADLTNANLTDADLSNANLILTDFTRATLCYADLQDAEFVGTDFTEADLSFADLTGAGLAGVDFTDAELRLANLTNADLGTAVLTGATMPEKE